MATQVISDGQIIVRNPADGTELERVSAHTPDQVKEAVLRARKAQPAWQALGFGERARLLTEVRDRFLDKANDVAELLFRENGKSQLEAYFSEVIPNIELFDWHIANDAKLLRPEPVKLNPMNYAGKKGVIQHLPLGVIGLISPWNYPVSIPLRTIIPALMAGNTLVFKPSEYSPLTGRMITEIFQASLPEGVLELAQGGGEAGAALIDAGVDRIIFTGSVATGRKVAVAAAEKLIPVSLELGGKDAALVLDDADLDRAAHGIAWAAFANCGQNCASIERVYVTDKVADAFIGKVVEITKRLRLTKEGPQAEVGPLVNENQVAVVDRHVKEAVSQGARVLTGGNRVTPGNFFEPTVLVGVDHRMAVMREESFGPLLPIQVVKNVDEAVRLANDSSYGLTASIWTRDEERARRIGTQLHTGIVTVNNHSFTAAIPQAPWTGVKETGSGVTNSRSALHEMTRPHFTLVDRNKATIELWWYPYTPTLEKLAQGVLGMSKRGLGSKLSAVGKLLPLLRKRMKES